MYVVSASKHVWEGVRQMGFPKPPIYVKLFCGIIASDTFFLEQAVDRLRAKYGEIDVRSPCWNFDITDYYQSEMGKNLLKAFVGFSRLYDPVILSFIKLETNQIEYELGIVSENRLFRRVNLDMGYLDASKVVLATTKNYSHRIYLRDGIYAEVTLIFREGKYRPLEWTYPDFRLGRYDEFFLECREKYLANLNQPNQKGEFFKREKQNQDCKIKNVIGDL